MPITADWPRSVLRWETGKVYWDLIDLEAADAVRGCDEGLLEPLSSADLLPAPDGTPAVEDFFPGMLTECGAGMLFYSTVYAYNPEYIAGPKPTTIRDFFDLEKFPGVAACAAVRWSIWSSL